MHHVIHINGYSYVSYATVCQSIECLHRMKYVCKLVLITMYCTGMKKVLS